MKKAPFLFLTILLFAALTLLSLAGRGNIYAGQELSFVKEPLAAAVFTGMHDGIFPWQMLDPDRRSELQRKKAEADAYEAYLKEGGQDAAEAEIVGSGTPKMPEPSESSLPSPSPVKETADNMPVAGSRTAPAPESTPTPAFPTGRLEPLRESTYEEYAAHISADIYGETGVLRAASYEFTPVTLDYFDDALFIGDSRTVGLSKYTDLAEHAEFFCETSLTVKKVFTRSFKGKGKLEEYLKEHKCGKIYIMVGLNELGTGTTEYFMKDYTEMVDRIREYQPDALLFLEAIMYVDKEKNDTDPIFKNSNILARNRAIASLADNETVFYIDVNEAVCDEEGNLDAELTFDHIHLKGTADALWEGFLLAHGVVKEQEAAEEAENEEEKNNS